MDVNELIQRYAEFNAGLYDQEMRTQLLAPVEYIMGLKSKKMRPLLALIGFYCYSNEVEKCLHAAHGLELFHNFTLMHDDIMDDAELRRGQQTSHIKYGLNEAIISGDAMAIMAYEYIIKDCPDANLRSVLQIFNKTAFDICIGQQMDMEFESKESISSQEYIEMIRLKTAIFLGLALQIGALLGGASDNDAEALFHFGESLGVGFQIQDDLMDLIGDGDKTGKIRGGDIIRNKKTLLICKANERANAEQRNQLNLLISENEMPVQKKLDEVIEIFSEVGIFPLVQTEIDGYFQRADDILNGLNLEDSKMEILRSIAQMIHQRKS